MYLFSCMSDMPNALFAMKLVVSNAKLYVQVVSNNQIRTTAFSR